MAKDCKNIIKELYPELDADYISDMIDDLDMLAAEQASKQTKTEVPQTYIEKKKALYEELVAKGQKAQAKRVKVIIEDFGKMDSLADRVGNTRFKNTREAIFSIFEDSEASSVSIDNLTKSMQADMGSLLIEGLRTIGFLKHAQSGDYDKQIYKIMMDGVDAQFVGKDADIINGIANVYRKMNMRSRLMVNNAGGDVAFNKHYVHKTHHNGDAIKNTPFEEWAADFTKTFDVEDALNLKRGPDGKFPESTIQDSIKKLKELYDNIEKNHNTLEDFNLEEAFGGTKSKNKVLDRLNRRRTYKPKDADKFYDYNQKYGTQRGLMSTLVSQHSNEARVAAMTTILGSNPADNLDQVIEKMLSMDKTLSQSQKTAIAHDVHKAFDVARQMGAYGHDSTMAKVGSALRTAKTLALLGKASITAFNDFVPTILHSSSVTGDSVITTALRSTGEFLSAFSPKARQEIAAEMMLMSETFQKEMLQRVHGGAFEAGRASKLVNTYFTVSGLEFITDVSKSANARLALTDLHKVVDNMVAGKSNQQNINFLKRNDISVKEIAVLHKLKASGVELTPTNIRRADPKMFGKVDKDELFRKVHMIIGQRTRQGVPTADAKVQRQLGLYTPADTAKGQAFRFFSQFKTTMLKAANDIAYIGKANSAEGNLQNADAIAAISKYTAFALGTGTFTLYLSRGLKDGFEEDFDITDPMTLMAGAIKGGAFGAFGDSLVPAIMFRGGQGKARALDSAIGPVPSAGIEFVNNLIHADGDGLTDDLLNMMPAKNIWWGEAIYGQMREDLY